MSAPPEVDPASIGVSFVDILFALAVGQVFTPVALWASEPAKNPLPIVSWFHLGVALTITITSWIGYHASANKARFQPQFVNVELVKLVLDISMVAVYFILAAYAVRQPVATKPETLLVLVAFVLYFCWDLASAWQKRDRDENPYRAAWDKVLNDPARLDVVKEWQPTDCGRVRATWVSLVLAAVVCACTWFGHGHLTPAGSIWIDVWLFAILIAYRLLKEHPGLLRRHRTEPPHPDPIGPGSATPGAAGASMLKFKVVRHGVSGAESEDEVECSRVSPLRSGASAVLSFEKLVADDPPVLVLVLPVSDIIRIELLDN